MKKTYYAPQVNVVEIKFNSSLLSVSTPTETSANVTFDGEFNEGSGDTID